MNYFYGNLVGGKFTKGSDPTWDWAKAGGGYAQNRDFFSVHWEVQERDPNSIRLHVEAPDEAADKFLNSIKEQVVEAILGSGIPNAASRAGYNYQQGSRTSAGAIRSNKSTEAFRVVLGSGQRGTTSERDIESVNGALGSYINGILEPFRAQLNRHFCMQRTPTAVPLQLANNVLIPNAVALLDQKFTVFRWEWYDGVRTPPDQIEPVDYAITIAMNSRATAGRMTEFMKVANRVETWLRQIPVDLCLADLDDSNGVWDAIRGLFDAACAAAGTKLSVASKVLHRKRPHLLPILDRVVVDHHYWPALTGFQKSDDPPTWFDGSWLKHGSWSDPSMYMRVMGDEIRHNHANLAQLRFSLEGKVPSSISDVRLVEAALYWHLCTRT